MGNGGHLYLVHLHLINIVNNVGAAEEKKSSSVLKLHSLYI